MRFDEEKFKALVHYIIWRCPDPAKLGSTKLNKILWFADSRAYELHGTPLTGATYIREKYGPVPRQIMPIRKSLESEKKIRVRRDKFYSFDKDVFESLSDPDPSVFSDEERQIIEYFIKYVCDEHTATSVSEESHDYVWEIAREGDVIPYHAVFAKRLREPNDDELERAKKAAREQGLIA